MHRKTLLAWPVVYGLMVVGCANTPQTPLSPSAATPADAFVNADGSTAKVSGPTGLRPHDVTLDTRRPTFSFENARTPAITGVAFDYEIEVQNEAGDVVYSRTFRGTSSGRSEHTVDTDFEYETNLWWRTRARLSSDTLGPFSDWATVRTPNRPPPPPPPAPITPPTVTGGGVLPFPVPAACGAFGPDNGLGCAAAIAAVSINWQGCLRGAGVFCHRFTREVIYALSQSDPNWKAILAAPGGHACHCGGCGPSNGVTMFREDTAVYAGSRVYDMIVGAGGPSPSLNWSLVPGPRSGDFPADAPVCQ
jgi:hypothetical protein